MEWQSIETAPKDGYLILVRRKNGGDFSGVYVAYWSAFDNSFVYNAGAPPLENLTHWMPIPAPPVSP